MFGIRPMRFDAARLQMAAEAARQIEHVDVVELDAVVAEHDLQPGDVGALRLRQLVDVALEEIDAASGIERDALDAVLEAAHRVHATGAQQLAQQIDQARSADALRRAAADHAEAERSVIVDATRPRSRHRAPACRTRSRRLRTPDRPGTTRRGSDARLPTISSVFVPMSMIATSRSSCARFDRQHAGRRVGADVAADDRQAVDARLRDGSAAGCAVRSSSGSSSCACPPPSRSR